MTGSVVAVIPAAGLGTPCTPGTNCYCDKVKGGALNDPLLLFCEDFEAPTLTTNTGLGNGAPYYGPWYDDTGLTNDRGRNSYWNQKYGNGVSSFLFSSGEPANPALGRPCAFALCTGAKVWERNDLWSANAYDPQLAFFTQSSDFSFESHHTYGTIQSLSELSRALET